MLLIRNAKVWQDQPSCSLGSWISVGKSGCILETSETSDSVSPPDDGSFEHVIDAGGSLVVPGLQDAHIHVCMTGESKHFLNLKDCDSIEALKTQLYAQHQAHIGSWIQGTNWDQTKLGRYPTRHDLDTACPDRPCFLWRACWHIGVANTRGLRLANILLDNGDVNPSLSTLCPPGGVIDVDADGPTGILRERAVELVLSVMSVKTTEEREKFIEEGLALCVSKGLTAVQTNDEGCLAVYQRLQREGKLPIRVFLTPNYEELLSDASLKPFRPLCIPASTAGVPSSSTGTARSDISGADPASLLVAERVKIFADGSLGAETAALRAECDIAAVSYDGKGNAGTGSESGAKVATGTHSGVLVHKAPALRDMIALAKDRGFRVEIHAIGDAAAEQVIDAFSAALVEPSERPVLTHCQVLGADLVQRMAIGGVVANIQPSFVPTDMHWVAKRGLRPTALSHAYAWKTLLMAGVVVAGGSDAPIETCSPLVGMYDAMCRRSRVDPSDVFRPEECLTFAEALGMYTTGAAVAAGCEMFLGRTIPGFFADLVILDEAVLSDPSVLQHTEPLWVIVGGRVVHKSEKKIAGFVATSAEPLPSPPPQPLHSTGHFPGKGGQPRPPRPSCEYDGQSPDFAGVCACRLLGRYCAATYR